MSEKSTTKVVATPKVVKAVKETVKPVKAAKPAKVKAESESNKISRSLAFKALVFSLHLSGMTSKQSFQEACAQMKVPVSAGMEQYPGSYMFDYKRTLTKNANSNDPEITSLFEKYNLKYNKATMTIGLAVSVANPTLNATTVTRVAANVKAPAVTPTAPAKQEGPKVVKKPVVVETTPVATK